MFLLCQAILFFIKKIQNYYIFDELALDFYKDIEMVLCFPLSPQGVGYSRHQVSNSIDTTFIK